MRLIFILSLIVSVSYGSNIDKRSFNYHNQYRSAPKKCNNKTTTIAVIDTGFGFVKNIKNAHLCKYGHKDFTAGTDISTDYNTVSPVPKDYDGHGTNIVGIIDKYAIKGNLNFCL